MEREQRTEATQGTEREVPASYSIYDLTEPLFNAIAPHKSAGRSDSQLQLAQLSADREGNYERSLRCCRYPPPLGLNSCGVRVQHHRRHLERASR